MSALPSLRVLAAALALVASFRPAFANTWTVAPAPGPGVDFTNLQTAIDTVPAGDVLLVANGAYGAIVLTKGLSIFGSGNTITDEITIRDVSGGPRVALASLKCENLTVLDCERVVLVDDVTVLDTAPGTVVFVYNDPVVRIERCTDVRLHRVTASSTRKTLHDGGGDAVWVDHSRVELVRCDLTGRNGLPGQWSSKTYGGNGTAGVGVGAASDVHVSLSQLRGGNGGDGQHGPKSAFDVYAGKGGDGIYVFPDSRVLVTGQPSDMCRGGRVGRVTSGDLGFGLYRYGGTARVSGATFVSDPPTLPPISGWGPLVQPVPADPSLELLSGPQTPGSLVTFAVHAEPGSSVRLRIGRRPIVEDLPFSAEDRLVENLRSYNLGVVPPSGDVFAEVVLSELAPLGALVVFQAACIETSSATEMSQSLPLIVR